MAQTDLVLFIAKLVAGGIIAFLAIMLWSKTRHVSWMCLVTGEVFSYAAIVFELLVKLGVASSTNLPFFGFGVEGILLLLNIATSLFIIVAFIMLLASSSRGENV
ncbi:MAG: hypothetical protein KBT11_01585 [Treponema sp.]|nr:hypothetical protein [Candidatus Treponema equifaecale]